MARLFLGGQPLLNITNGNLVLAHLQYVAFESFRRREGFFITFYGGFDDDGHPIPPNSVWCDPAAPLRFLYDAADEPIDIDEEYLEALRSAMKDPIGVIIGPGGGTPVLPFKLLSTERLPRTEE